MANSQDFQKEGFQFLKQLEKNNNRDWFQPLKRIYEEKVKAPMVAFLEDVRNGMEALCSG